MSQDTLAPAQSATSALTARMLLVRHGTTRMNKEDRYRGRRDIPLDAQGYQDAVDAARALSDVGLTAVYSSTLRRAQATAQIIADEAGVPDIRLMHGLVNVDYGAWEGLTPSEVAEHYPEAWEAYRTDPATAVCTNGERLTDAAARFVEALQLIGSRHVGETVCVVTHAVMIRLGLWSITNAAGPEWRFAVGRGSITSMLWADGQLAFEQPPTGGAPD